MKKRVVITGLGAISGAGEGADALWRAALEKKSAIGKVSFGGHEPLEVLGAAVRDFVPERYVTQKKSIKVMARDIQLAVAAASLAVDDAKARSARCARDRFGVIVGSGVLNHEPEELAYSVKNSLDEKGVLSLKKFGEDGLRSLFPLWLLKYLPNMSACHISILFDLQGPNNSITTGASAGLQAIAEATRIISRGDADLMLAGGAESKLNPVGLAEYRVLGVLSRTNDPKKAVNPFDSDGLVIGEGAAFLVLEKLEHAKKRGANIYAEVIGLGSSASTGQAIAMRQALKEAGIGPEDIDHLQASGIGIPADDRAELVAVKEVFNGASGSLRLGVSKSLVGFTGFASGAIDMVLSAMMLKTQIAPPTSETDRSASKKIRHLMINAFGFNGQSVSVVLKSFGEQDA